MKIINKVLKSVEIETVAAEGKCIAKHEGQIIFVKGVAPGDICDLRITRKKKSFSEAVPIAIHHYSDLRADPFCEHYALCGGCKWQHLSYEAQLNYKRQQVIDSLQRIAKVSVDQLESVRPILASTSTAYYRNKLEYTFSDARWLTSEEIASGEQLERNALGFHIPGRFDKILDINHCHLQPEPSNKIRLAVKKHAIAQKIPFFNLVKQTGFLRNLIIRTTTAGEVMVILQVTEHQQDWIDAILAVIAQFEEVTSLHYVVNNKGNDTFSDLEVTHAKGSPYIEEQMTLPGGDGQISFRIGPKSFYQTNAQQAEALYKRAWEMAQLDTRDTVYDLYTGTGTIANYIASSVSKVVGIEYVSEAIEYAKVNAEVNGITNATFFAGDMKALLSKSFFDQHGAPDVIITDPPRAGMHPDVCDVLASSGAKRIVYISCNPATQARDIERLSARYKVVEVQPIDMFPHTHHVECVVLLELYNS